MSFKDLPNLLTNFLFLFNFFKSSRVIHGTLLALASSQCFSSPRTHTLNFGLGTYLSLKLIRYVCFIYFNLLQCPRSLFKTPFFFFVSKGLRVRCTFVQLPVFFLNTNHPGCCFCIRKKTGGKKNFFSHLTVPAKRLSLLGS